MHNIYSQQNYVNIGEMEFNTCKRVRATRSGGDMGNKGVYSRPLKIYEGGMTPELDDVLQRKVHAYENDNCVTVTIGRKVVKIL